MMYDVALTDHWLDKAVGGISIGVRGKIPPRNLHSSGDTMVRGPHHLHDLDLPKVIDDPHRLGGPATG
jgi:hypothetical protein